MKQHGVSFGLCSLAALIAAGLMIGTLPDTIASSAALTNTPSPIPTFIPTGTSNKVWTPVERDFDGVTMVLVPAGCFMMGSTEAQIDDAFALAQRAFGSEVKRAWFDDEKPAHEVCFEQPFWIDKYEVSQTQFRQFNGQARVTPYLQGNNLPVQEIDWFESKTFCETRGARLPTEAEWEYAARGPESLVYPWGNDFIPENVVYYDNSEKKPAPVGSRPGGKSWVGALDMAGNMTEWVSSLYQPYPYHSDDGREADTGTRTGVSRVARGGAWGFKEFALRTAFHFAYSPEVRGGLQGLRCARSFSERKTQITPTPVAAVTTPIPADTANTCVGSFRHPFVKLEDKKGWG